MSDHPHTTSSALLEQLVYIDNFMSTNGSNAGDTPNLDIDGQLSMDLAAFADDSFIFPDEDKPKNNRDADDDDKDTPIKEDPDKKKGLLDDHQPSIDSAFLESSHENTPGTFQLLPTQSHHGHSHHHSGHVPSHVHHDSLHSLGGPLNDNLANLRPSTRPPKQTVSTSFLDQINVSKLPKFPVPPGAKSSLVSAGLSQNQIDLLSALIAQHQTSLGNSIPPSAASSPDLHRQHVPHLPSQASSSFNFNSPVRQHNQIPSLVSRDKSDFDIANFRSNTPGYGINSPLQQSPSSTSSVGTSGSTSTFSAAAAAGHGSSGSSNGGFVSSELDKRRRNTAASARFRIKKKLKEKQMENQLLNLNELIKDFEVKVQQLEMENKLLRNLIIEKGSKKSDQELKVLRERARMG